MFYAVMIFIILLLIFGGWYISVSNKLKRLTVKINEANSGIDVALNKRYDVLTKMIEVVKSYTKHESEILFKIIKLRNEMTMQEKHEANLEMDKSYEQIKVIAENYPELKSSENFKTLQNAIVETEEHLQAARRLYNSNISYYNQAIVVFPNSIIAKAKNYQQKDFFEVEDNKKNDVKMNLS